MKVTFFNWTFLKDILVQAFLSSRSLQGITLARWNTDHGIGLSKTELDTGTWAGHDVVMSQSMFKTWEGPNDNKGPNQLFGSAGDKRY